MASDKRYVNESVRHWKERRRKKGKARKKANKRAAKKY
jgi:hypothetical protein|tara:strand:- start:555 stop:668 length:114 start_codon:yes stop_codon:yes gene_type:complete